MGNVSLLCYNGNVAPLPVITDVFRVAFLWQSTDLPKSAVNVMHFEASGKTASQVATAIDAHVTAGMWFAQNSHAAVTELDVTPLDGSGTTFTFATASAAKWKGGSSTFDVNPQVAAVVKMVTAKRGRSYRGRVFLPWVAENRVTNGAFDPTDLAAVNALWATFLTDMNTASVHPVIASYLHATSERVTGVSFEARTATQRRRQNR